MEYEETLSSVIMYHQQESISLNNGLFIKKGEIIMYRPFDFYVDKTEDPTPGEAWVTLNWNGRLVPRYSISSKGRMYDHEWGSFVNYSTDKDGYYMASVNIFGEYKKIRVHRWELMSFYPNPNFMNLQTNHKDGNKQNLDLNNLEWLTPIGNTRHGWDTGLNQNIGTNNGVGKYTDEDVHTICRLIDQGYTNAEICTAFGITDKKLRMRFSGSVSGIRYGKTHRNISINYNFMKGAKVQNRYSLEFAELICQFLSDPNRVYTYKEIMDLLDIPNEERKNFKIFIDDLIRGRTCKSVTEKYNLNKPIQGKDEFSYLMR